jgi:hypothetical protein
VVAFLRFPLFIIRADQVETISNHDSSSAGWTTPKTTFLLSNDHNTNHRNRQISMRNSRKRGHDVPFFRGGPSQRGGPFFGQVVVVVTLRDGALLVRP